MSEQLFRAIELPSDEPVQYVGVYVLKWGRVEQPTIGFVEANDHTPIMLEALQWLIRIYCDDASIDELEDAIAFAEEAIS